MLQILSGFPDNVIAVRASGKVLGAEYRSILIPVDKEKRKTHEKLNLFYQFGPDYESIDADGMWEDTKLDVGHWNGWSKIAIIADDGAIRMGAHMAEFILRRPVRVFSNDEADKARAWVSEGV
ncbi:MAG: STAS/SEC14 domain-containing protein [Anaerolineales bacterium]|jgi:hypothetical protein